MIVLYEQDANDWTTNGLAILTPISCTVSEEAGADYSLEMAHPIDPAGKWALLIPDRLIKVPVPVLCVPAIEAYSQSASFPPGAQLWKVTTKTAIYSHPSIMVTVTYTDWVAGRGYSPGDKVTYNNQNYECKTAHGGIVTSPDQNPNLWKKISRTSGSGIKLKDMPVGAEFIFLEFVTGGNWMKCMTKDGSITGYIQTSCVQYIRDLDDQDIETEATEERVITDQVFRIHEIERNLKNKTVTVHAKHISYDRDRLALLACDIYESTVPSALAYIQEATRPTVTYQLATNITGGKITQDYSWRNPISALLDPDTGVAPLSDAMVVRDNLDIFILKNTKTDRGYRIRYGGNLEGVTWKEDTSGVITVIIPKGKDEDGAVMLLPEVMIESDLRYQYAAARVEVLDVADATVGSTWTDPDTGDVHTRTQEDCYTLMRNAAKARFDTDGADKEEIELTVQFLLLGDTVEFAQYKELENVCLYDLVTIEAPPIGVDVKAQVISYTWDALTQRYTGIKLGTLYKKDRSTVAGYELSPGSIELSKLSAAALKTLQS